MRLHRHTRVAVVASIAALLAGCSPASAPSPSATITNVEPTLIVTSSDFVDGGALDPRHSANAWGQCSGANLNPQLSWEGAPEGTVTYAITALDRSAGNYVHWVHANIPGDVTSVATGGSETLAGVAGVTGSATTGYFGPCPPGPNHRYEFTVWALDSELELTEPLTYPGFFQAAKDHVLAKGSIVGTFSPAG